MLKIKTVKIEAHLSVYFYCSVDVFDAFDTFSHQSNYRLVFSFPCLYLLINAAHQHFLKLINIQ